MSGWSNRQKANCLNGGADLDTDTIKVLLVTSTYTFDPDNNFVSGVTNELSGGNYVRKTVTPTVTQDDTADAAYADIADTTWTALGAAAGTPARAIFYKFVSTDANSPIVGCVDLTSPPAPNGGDYTLVWSANGIIRVA